ncbi:amino acid adenylation domain-containing protein [Cupriavidus sp. P-10]|uniref:non-ribosomal peptide synthetase n=1 Tax=Cupriavidus sp. P-10 TaxID=2027911 RepID=UPI000E2ED6C2|nr:non-ribosomal peptide synthetase [Cupriavidus sp. P-10]BDB27750.1 amino acid adenylation domain-containing protein [Cupriavidus sp. P-10]
MSDALSTAHAQVAARFARLDPAQRTAFLSALHGKGVAFATLPIVPDPRAAALPLSYAQQRLWFLQQLEPASTAYHMPGVYRLEGRLDADALRRAFAQIGARHEVLRTTYPTDAAGVACQHVHEDLPPAFAVIDANPDGLDAAIARVVHEPFDLAAGPLWRVALIREGAQSHVLVVVLHHIVADGASIVRLVAELAACYAAEADGTRAGLAPLPLQYADYAAWQRNWMEAGEAQRQLGYWRERLGDCTGATLDLPADRPRRAARSGEGAEHVFTIPAAVAEALRTLAATRHATLNMALLAAYAVLLGRYTGQADLRIGVPVANRQRSETEALIGCFVNIQVMRAEVDPDQPFADLLARLATQAAADQEHQSLPFDLLVEALQPDRSLGQPALFNVTFDHRTAGAATLPQLAGLRVTPLELPVTTARFELSLATAELPDGSLCGRIAYAADLFDAATVARMAGHYVRLLQAFAADPATTPGTAVLFADAERAALARWSQPDCAATPFVAVHSRVSAHARRAPAAPAVLYGDHSLAYGELERQANRLAHWLIAQGIGAECRVGVALNRSPRMLVALLAVLKAGACFVPFDPAYPARRLLDMQEDAAPQLLLTERALRDAFPVMPGLPVLLADDDNGASWPDHDPGVPIHREQLAYVIYTSGSTGRPKGVAVAHGPLAMHVVTTAECYDITAASRELHFLSFTFDGAHERWMVPLASGASIVLRDDALWSVEQTYAALRCHAVTHAGFPPRYLHQLAAWAESQGNPPPLWLYSFGGEAMPRAGVERLTQALRPQHIINGYGPTETVVTPLVWKAAAAEAAAQVTGAYAPIGRPVGSRSAHVLDSRLEPVPVGVPGELYLGGEGLARGYLGRAGMTADRFIPDPYGAPGARLYRTGDLVRWRPDGCIEYLGRQDHQVKIRGFRIELGEIEAHLLAQPEVRQAVVLPHETPAGTRLVGYVAAPASVQAEALRSALAAALPDYMVPAAMLRLDSLPVTPNGKLDRRALPEPQWQAETAFAAPVSVPERMLAAVWADVLGIAQVGLHDNFFALGGDSILSLQIVARARLQGWRLTPRQVFEHQTVAALAQVAQRVDVAAEDAANDAAEHGAAPLTPVQRAFLAQPLAAAARNRFNQSVLLQSQPAIDTAALRAALADVVGHHAALRFRFRHAEDGWHQQAVAEAADAFVLTTADAPDAAAITAACDAEQGKLDIEQGPLLRALQLRVGDGTERLFLVCHHLVVDGVSWRIVLEDLQAAYAARVGGQAPALAPVGASYAAWSRALAGPARAVFAAEDAYWQAVAEGDLDLPGDAPDASQPHPDGARTASFALDAATTDALLRRAHAAYRTGVNDLLLAAFARALCAFTGRDEIRIHVEGHGREAEAAGSALDLSRTVGWFTSIWPVRLACVDDLGDTIAGVKEALRAVPRQGLGYGVLGAAGAAPQVLFNYLGQFDGSLRAEAGSWQVATEDTGSGMSAGIPLPAPLAFDGRVQHGCLQFRCTYRGGQFREATVDTLLARIAQALRDVVAHCVAQPATRLTPSDVPASGLSQAQLDALALPADELDEIDEIDDIDDIWPPTPMQRGMVRHGARHPDSPAYMVQVQATMDGLDVERMVAAWQGAVRRHPVLRARVAWLPAPEGAEPLLVVPAQAQMPVTHHDWRDRGNRPQSAADDAQWQALCEAEFRQPFDLCHAPLMRLTLVRIADDAWRFLWTWHHLLLDGWSMSRLLGEVLRGYDGEQPAQAALSLRRYVAWQQAQPGADEHWKARLAPLQQQPVRITRDVATPAQRGQQMGAVEHVVPADTLRTLAAFASRQHVTVNTLVQAAWLLALRQATGARTVGMAVVGSGRSAELPGIEDIMGLLASTLPLVQDLPDMLRVADWLPALQADNLALRETEHAPPAWLQSWAAGSDDTSQAPFDTMLIYENYPVDSTLRETERGALRFSDVDNRGQMSYPVTAIVIPRETLTLRVEFDTAALDHAAARDLARQCMSLLLALPALADATLAELPARIAGGSEGHASALAA